MVVLLLIMAAGVFVVYAYNGLVVLRQRVNNAWAQVDVQLKRRYDLIPNLVNTVKGYATHERDTFSKITEARSKALAAGNANSQAEAETELTSTLRTLFALAENYPELKADANFRKLQEELSNTESKIAFARQFYNDTVQKYNIRLEVFPVNLIATNLGFKPRDFFNLELQSAEREPINVDFHPEDKQ